MARSLWTRLMLRSDFKTPSEVQWLRCPALRDFPPDLIIFVGRPAYAGFASDFIEQGAAQPPVNAHILAHHVC